MNFSRIVSVMCTLVSELYRFFNSWRESSKITKNSKIFPKIFPGPTYQHTSKKCFWRFKGQKKNKICQNLWSLNPRKFFLRNRIGLKSQSVDSESKTTPYMLNRKNRPTWPFLVILLRERVYISTFSCFWLNLSDYPFQLATRNSATFWASPLAGVINSPIFSLFLYR